MNQNVSATKRKRFVTFATSIVDNLCSLYTAISRKVVGKRRMRQSRKAMDVCFQMLKESNKSDKSRFDSYSVRNSVLSISHTTFRDCQVHIFSNNLSRTAVNGTQSKYDCCDSSSTCHTNQISWQFPTFHLSLNKRNLVSVLSASAFGFGR